MLGQATSSLRALPRRYMQRLFGDLDINTRQKWRAVWPFLSVLPRTVRLLDAGCGAGSWSLELAARRNGWTIVGLDHDRQSIEMAEKNREELGLQNVSFVEDDFLRFKPAEQFEAVLSVTSAHYLAQAGSGSGLFERFSGWLKEDGLLILFGPRRSQETPTLSVLPPLHTWSVFGYEDLKRLCQEGGLTPELIRPVIGRLGTVAKQISRVGGVSNAVRAVTYPLQVLLDSFDRGNVLSIDRPSAAWLLIARKKQDSTADSGGAPRRGMRAMGYQVRAEDDAKLTVRL